MKTIHVNHSGDDTIAYMSKQGITIFVYPGTHEYVDVPGFSDWVRNSNTMSFVEHHPETIMFSLRQLPIEADAPVVADARNIMNSTSDNNGIVYKSARKKVKKL